MNLSGKKTKERKCARSDCEFSERLCWDKEGRRVPNPGTSGTEGSLISFASFQFPLETIEGKNGPAHGASPEYENNPARVVQVVKPKTLVVQVCAGCMI